MDSELLDKLLNFGPYWEVEKITHTSDSNEIDIYMKFKMEAYKSSKSDYKGLHDYRNYRRWRHLDILQYKTYIKARIPRIKDEQGNVRSVEIPWATTMGRHTYLFESRAIEVLLATKNQTKSAELMRCGFNVINKIIHLSTQRGLSRRSKDTNYKQLSIDEKSFKKGHKYVSVLSDPERGTIIDVVENRTLGASKELLNNNLNEVQKQNISFVSMDMWKGYIGAVKQTLPNTQIVHDRFHLIKYLNQAVDRVRRRETKKYETLKNSRYSFLKNTYNLTIKQYFKFEEVLTLNTSVSLAWRLKECFKSLFGASDYQEAFTRFSDWRSFCTWEKIPEINKVVSMFEKHIVGVCNALVEKISNAMAERLNGKIQEIKTIGRGYRTFDNFRSALLFFNGGLKLYPHY